MTNGLALFLIGQLVKNYTMSVQFNYVTLYALLRSMPNGISCRLKATMECRNVGDHTAVTSVATVGITTASSPINCPFF